MTYNQNKNTALRLQFMVRVIHKLMAEIDRRGWA